MNFDVKTEAGRICLSGTIGHDVAVAAREALVQALSQQTGEVVVELSGLKSARSVVLSILLRLIAEAEKRQLSLRLEGMPRQLFEMARVSGLDGILPIESLAV